MSHGCSTPKLPARAAESGDSRIRAGFPCPSSRLQQRCSVRPTSRTMRPRTPSSTASRTCSGPKGCPRRTMPGAVEKIRGSAEQHRERSIGGGMKIMPAARRLRQLTRLRGASAAHVVFADIDWPTLTAVPGEAPSLVLRRAASRRGTGRLGRRVRHAVGGAFDADVGLVAEQQLEHGAGRVAHARLEVADATEQRRGEHAAIVEDHRLDHGRQVAGSRRSAPQRPPVAASGGATRG